MTTTIRIILCGVSLAVAVYGLTVLPEASKPLRVRLYINKPAAPEERKRNVNEDLFHRVVEAVHQAESSGQIVNVPDGDGGRAVGPFQIWPIMVDEVNRILKRKVYYYRDRHDYAASRAMCAIYLRFRQRHGKIEDPVQLASLWNRPDGKAPESYRQKIRKAMVE